MRLKYSLFIVVILLLSGCSNSKHLQSNSGSLLTPPVPPTPARYRQELEVVRRGKFKKMRVLNRKEEQVYWNLMDYCNQKNYKLFAQVSLGEILSSSGEEYRYINSKRVDFCITDKSFYPIAVVEYQGSGHHNETSEERDSVKREAVEKAGISYISLNVGRENDVEEELRGSGI